MLGNDTVNPNEDEPVIQDTPIQPKEEAEVVVEEVVAENDNAANSPPPDAA